MLKLGRIRVFFAWYDMWVGFYYDRLDCVLYVCVIPMIVIRIPILRKSRVWEISKKYRLGGK